MAGTSEPWLVVGLGNPGTQYESTLHNLGRATVTALASSLGVGFRRDKGGLMVADAFIGSPPDLQRAYLAFATTFMNVTGPQVAAFARRFSIDADHLLVVHDDLDLPAHELRLKRGGGEGGHNGLRSITAALGTRDYERLRIGIGRPPGRMDAASYVLAKIPRGDQEEWGVTEQRAADVACDVIATGFTATQQILHSGS